jgi:hypothetical protein
MSHAFITTTFRKLVLFPSPDDPKRTYALGSIGTASFKLNWDVNVEESKTNRYVNKNLETEVLRHIC